jgi:hypothetical protein
MSTLERAQSGQEKGESRLTQQRGIPGPKKVTVPNMRGRSIFWAKITWKHVVLFAIACMAEHFAEPTIVTIVQDLVQVFKPLADGLSTGLGTGQTGAYVVTGLLIIAIAFCICVSAWAAKNKDGDE